ncbi:MAG TPA: hypothetical protein VI300_30330, partial [Solirubrobacter sp.]
MRGPADGVIETQLAGAEGASVEADTEPLQRPTGGKPLLRLLNLLEGAGYSEQATATIGLAVDGDSPDELRAQIDAYVTLPHPGNGAKSPKRSRKRAAKRAPEAVAEEVALAHMAAAEQLGPPTATGPQWRSLGPWTIPNGQTYGASRVNVSGRVAAIAIDPSNPAHVLVGAAGGGVWESLDRGASWAPRTDFAPTLAVGAVVFDRTNPRIAYCGLGEGNWWWWLGAGILRSSDGGASWSQLCTAPFVGQGFFDLAVDPANGQHLLAATTGGLYVSTNGGTGWTQRRAARTWSIAFGGGEILAACSDGLWRSTDGGTTWTKVT